MTAATPAPAASERQALLYRAERAAVCIYIAADKEVADDVSDILKQLVAALRDPGPARADFARKWLPIDGGGDPAKAAPKDGTNVLVCVAGVPRSVGEAYWWQNAEGRGGWQTWDGENRTRTVYSPGPTHWRPLPIEAPAPPADAGNGEG